jgi:hypothetical protein
MNLSRPFFLSLLIAVCVGTVAAQSSPEETPASPQPPLALSQNAQASPDLFQIHFNADWLDLSHTTLSFQPEPNSIFVPAPNSRRLQILTLDPNDAACYTIRAYRVARISPDSDATRPAGYSTCLRSSRFQFKTAVDSREIVPR